MASYVCGGLELLVIFANELSISLGVVVSRKASKVADGGVFSPKIAFGGGLDVGRRLGVSLLKSLPPGVGVPDRVGLLSGDLFSLSNVNARDRRSGDAMPPAFSK